MDKLDDIFQMQQDLEKYVTSSRYPKKLEAKISSLSVAIIHEAVELQRLTNWKWWKRSQDFNILLAKEEVVDILHFVIQASLELGMSPTELVEEYSKKHKINKKRQELKY
ncbi:MAG: dUTPase [Nitrososphaeraceae archaeon]|nr:dUTPase [Nitrososphaeraceae archaeon]